MTLVRNQERPLRLFGGLSGDTEEIMMSIPVRTQERPPILLGERSGDTDGSLK